MARRSGTARRAYRRLRKERTQELARLHTEGQGDSPKALTLRPKLRPSLLRRAEPQTPEECAARVRALTTTLAAAADHLCQGTGWRNRRVLRLVESARNARGALLEHLATTCPHVRDALCTELNLT